MTPASDSLIIVALGYGNEVKVGEFGVRVTVGGLVVPVKVAGLGVESIMGEPEELDLGFAAAAAAAAAAALG